MAPPKKMSLSEFFSDESYGGSWADEDFDMASISVPIEKNRHYGHNSENRFGGPFGGSRGGLGKPVDNGPPYIVKFSNLPLISDDRFIEDLFRSRFTPLVKYKVVYDPASNPLESGIIKKVAFVEVNTFTDQAKVVRWQDVLYKGTRRINMEIADFQDFQYCMSFNQDNRSRLLQVEQEFFSRPRQSNYDERPMGDRGRMHGGRAPGGMPLDDIIPSDKRRLDHRMHSGHSNKLDHVGHVIQIPTPPLQAKPKSNPFGNAKPVDVISKEHEMENAYASEHHSLPAQVRRNSSSASSQRPIFGDGHKTDNSQNGKSESVNFVDQKQTFADILSTRKEREPVKTPKSSVFNSTTIRKPVVLKKKTAGSSETVSNVKAAPVDAEKTEKASDLSEESERIQKPATETSNPQMEPVVKTPQKALNREDAGENSRKESNEKERSKVGDSRQEKGPSSKQRPKKGVVEGGVQASQRTEEVANAGGTEKRTSRKVKDSTARETSAQGENAGEQKKPASKESAGKISAPRKRSSRKKEPTQSSQTSTPARAGEVVSGPDKHEVQGKYPDNEGSTDTSHQKVNERGNRRGRGGARRGRGGSRGGRGGQTANASSS